MSLTAFENNRRDVIALLHDRRHKFKLYRELETESRKEWLIKDWIGDGEASAWYGAPGSGKSVLIQDVALHIAAGLEWHGRTVKRGAVLYVALERRSLVERRAIAFRNHCGLPDLPFAVIGGPLDLRNPKAADSVVDCVREVEAETGELVTLIVLDTVSRAIAGGDENSSADMGAIVGATSKLQAETKAHVAWVHHIPTAGGERLRGHGALLGAMDTTIFVEKLGELRTATVAKANDSEEGASVAFTLDSVTIGEETTAPIVVPADLPKPAAKEPGLAPNLKTMFGLLHDAGSTGLSTDEWNEKARAIGLGTTRRASLHDWRSALMAKHLVRESGGRWYVRF